MSDDTTDTTAPAEPNPWDGYPADEAAPSQGGAIVRADPRADWPFVLSITAEKPPFLVIRAEDATDLNQQLTALDMAGTWVQIWAHHQSAKAHGLVATQLSGTPVPQQPQAQPLSPVQQGFQAQAQQQPQWGPPLGAGGQPGTAPAPWQNTGAPVPQQQGWGGAPQGQQGPLPTPPGWYRVTVPYPARDVGKAINDNLKAQGLYQGNVKWDPGPKQWLVSPAVMGAFAQFNPIPG